MIVCCFGTGTEVGKTWVGAATLARLARAGLQVAARKPVQSFAPDELGATDAELLAAATGESAHLVCPAAGWFPVPMAPPMAAEVLGRAPPRLRELVDRVVWPSPAPTLGWVEGVGGPHSPIASDGDSLDLAVALAPDVSVLVADAGLGTINAVRLCLAALQVLDPTPLVVLNRFDVSDTLHVRNRAWLADHLGDTPFISPDELADHLRERLA